MSRINDDANKEVAACPVSALFIHVINVLAFCALRLVLEKTGRP